jgi:transposase InsO family protein
VAYDSIADGDHPKVLLTKNTTNALRSDALFVDSGASRHLSPDRKSFVTYTILAKPIPIQLGDNSQIYAIGCGTRRTHVETADGVQSIDFTRTLHAPKLAGSLLSVGQLTAVPGVKLEFEGMFCLIKLHGETLCQAAFKDGLYTLNLASTVVPNGSSFSVLKAKIPPPAGKRLDILTLHRRMGHLNISDLRKLVSSKMVDGLDMGIAGDDFTCDACLRGKTPRKPFPTGGRKRATRVLELVHSDVCGPLPISIGGSRYFITFTDDHTAHVDVDFMKHKSSALARFRTWKARVEKETGQKIGKIRTDNGSEYTSDEFEALLESNGIVHQTTAPHSSQQGGVAERMNRTLEDSARANLTEAGLPIGFWPDAVLYGATTRNYCPTRSSLDGRIPEEAWTNERQDVSHLRPFGCEVYVSVLPVKG